MFFIYGEKKLKLLFRYDFLGCHDSKVLDDEENDWQRTFDDFSNQTLDEYIVRLQARIESLEQEKTPPLQSIETLQLKMKTTDKPRMLWFLPEKRTQAVRAIYMSERDRQVHEMMV